MIRSSKTTTSHKEKDNSDAAESIENHNQKIWTRKNQKIKVKSNMNTAQ